MKGTVFKTTFVKNGNLSLFLKYNSTASEKPDRETILLIHGYPDEHSTWDLQMELLSREFNVGAFDLRGTGNSDKPIRQKDYNAYRLFEDFEAVIRFLGGSERIHLVAHDWGAILSWGFIGISKYSKLLKSYTAMGGPHPLLSLRSMIGYLFSFRPAKILVAVRQSFLSWYILFFQIPFLPELSIRCFTKPIWKYLMWAAEIPENDPIRFMTREKILSNAIYPVNLYRELLRGNFPIPKRITVPTRVLVPMRDMAIRPESYDSLSEVCDRVEFFAADSNHWIQKEMPEFVADKIRDFVLTNSKRE
ncbi:alpha/beta fold hydrolase [Leptospira gomenensis]|uniref:Alpha/beta fold hydrolase n=1 Tax=Leptospira gomenensis TaxID=2484974 RepID=A0A5F1Z1C2_9LEPT|nr:alpha/beta fold hydrolase [Leptospira gomenensis]TGK39199.1 alpha/beta fold hydrolase [Leptospira gomenensis]TGK44260.1 alpha/beta fold hydrolase [Leptospira gomenensis]TGK45070.1 alpha/beta fold hydrolase [Leptospira gomenensis]TGK65122.1 alpha/beta fold hydrolase [Leptospira gomenensis]